MTYNEPKGEPKSYFHINIQDPAFFQFADLYKDTHIAVKNTKAHMHNHDIWQPQPNPSQSLWHSPGGFWETGAKQQHRCNFTSLIMVSVLGNGHIKEICAPSASGKAGFWSPESEILPSL